LHIAIYTFVAVSDDDHSDDGVLVTIVKVRAYIHANANIEYDRLLTHSSENRIRE